MFIEFLCGKHFRIAKKAERGAAPSQANQFHLWMVAGCFYAEEIIPVKIPMLFQRCLLADMTSQRGRTSN